MFVPLGCSILVVHISNGTPAFFTYSYDEPKILTILCWLFSSCCTNLNYVT